jgi:hypothetical protein
MQTPKKLGPKNLGPQKSGAPGSPMIPALAPPAPGEELIISENGELVKPGGKLVKPPEPRTQPGPGPGSQANQKKQPGSSPKLTLTPPPPPPPLPPDALHADEASVTPIAMQHSASGLPQIDKDSDFQVAAPKPGQVTAAPASSNPLMASKVEPDLEPEQLKAIGAQDNARKAVEDALGASLHASAAAAPPSPPPPLSPPSLPPTPPDTQFTPANEPAPLANSPADQAFTMPMPPGQAPPLPSSLMNGPGAGPSESSAPTAPPPLPPPILK